MDSASTDLGLGLGGEKRCLSTEPRKPETALLRGSEGVTSFYFFLSLFRRPADITLASGVVAEP